MKRIITLICCLCTFLFAGCSLKESVSESSSGRAPFVLSYPESLQKQGFPDALCLEKRPKRVVTLTNSPVLALYELGVNQVVSLIQDPGLAPGNQGKGHAFPNRYAFPD